MTRTKHYNQLRTNARKAVELLLLPHQCVGSTSIIFTSQQALSVGYTNNQAHKYMETDMAWSYPSIGAYFLCFGLKSKARKSEQKIHMTLVSPQEQTELCLKMKKSIEISTVGIQDVEQLLAKIRMRFTGELISDGYVNPNFRNRSIENTNDNNEIDISDLDGHNSSVDVVSNEDAYLNEQYNILTENRDVFNEDRVYSAEDQIQSKRRFSEQEVRESQHKFRKVLDILYGNRCAVTGNSIRCVLEAAHILPHTSAKSNYDRRNGILLRVDIHRLFDANKIDFVWKQEELQLVILDENLKNTDSGYSHLENCTLTLPSQKEDWPLSAYLIARRTLNAD